MLDPDEFICQAADYYFEGLVENDHLGIACDGGRDWDGDGVVDVVLGGNGEYHAVSSTSHPGVMHLYLGPLVSGPETNPDNLQPFDVRVEGEHGGSGFGISVAFVGDINGDGREDLAVGAWNWSVNPSASPPLQQGALYLFLGRDPAMLPTGTGGVFVADDLGNTASAPGITSKIIRGNVLDRFGWSIARLGDVDGDGYDDFAVGAPGNGLDDPATGKIGGVHVFYGDVAYWNQLADIPIGDASLSPFLSTLAAPPGSLLGDRFGYSMSLAGDVNGDSINDLFVGAPRGDLLEAALGVFPGSNLGPGYAALYAGSASPSLVGVVLGEFSKDTFGTSVTSLFDDLDGDGVIDLAVGAPGWDFPPAPDPDNSGRAYILSGAGVLASTLTTIGLALDGEFSDDRFGHRVAGDPFFPDSTEAVARLAVSAPFYNWTGPASPCACWQRLGDLGKVYVYCAASEVMTASYKGETGRDRLGLDVAWIGNVGGLAFGDLLCTGAAWPEGITSCPMPAELGRAYITLY